MRYKRLGGAFYSAKGMVDHQTWVHFRFTLWAEWAILLLFCWFAAANENVGERALKWCHPQILPFENLVEIIFELLLYSFKLKNTQQNRYIKPQQQQQKKKR
jgi:hypothetical protein